VAIIYIGIALYIYVKKPIFKMSCFYNNPSGNPNHEQGFSYSNHPEKATGYMKQLGTWIKQPQCEGGHAPSSITEVKNESSHASIPP
jgi:hypothetical protein